MTEWADSVDVAWFPSPTPLNAHPQAHRYKVRMRGGGGTGRVGVAPVQTHSERPTTMNRQMDKRVSTYNHLPAGRGAGWGEGNKSL